MGAIDNLINRNRQTRMLAEKRIEILNIVSYLMSLMEDVYTEISEAGIPIILPYDIIHVKEQGNFAYCQTGTGGDPDKSLLVVMDKERNIKYSVSSSLKDPEDYSRKKIPVSRSEFIEKQLPLIIKELKKTR